MNVHNANIIATTVYQLVLIVSPVTGQIGDLHYRIVHVITVILMTGLILIVASVHFNVLHA